MNRANRALLSWILVSSLLPLSQGCSKSGGGLYSPEIAYELLDQPGNFVESGTAFQTTSSTNYIFADSTGAILSTTNQITVTDPDPATPLTQLIPNAVFSDQMDSGGCALGTLITGATDSSNSTLYTSISASACEDQSVIELDYDTSLLGDAAGNTGDVVASETFTVDNAPISVAQSGVTQSAATGYSTADGVNGTLDSYTAGGAGIYTITGSVDASVVMTFSKSMTGGTLTPAISGCSVTITSATAVGDGTVVVWTLGNLPSGSAISTTTCDLDISALTDAAGNPVDPNDPNLTSMTLTFQ